MDYCKTTTSETAMNLFDRQLENCEDYIIALHPFDWESAMLHHCAASFQLRTSNVTTYSDHCTVSFRPTIENLQCNTSCDKPFRPTFSDVQHTPLGRVSLQRLQLRATYDELYSTDDVTNSVLAPLVRVSLQQLQTTDYGLQTTDYGYCIRPLRPTIGNLQWLLQLLLLRATYDELSSTDDTMDLILAPLGRVSLQRLELRATYNELYSTDDKTDLAQAPLVRVSFQQLRTTDYGLRTTDYGLRTTDIALDPFD
jgi:hypothetical protein